MKRRALSEGEVKETLRPWGDVLKVWTRVRFFSPLPFERSLRVCVGPKMYQETARKDYDAPALKMLERAMPAPWARKMLEEWVPK